ncbi:MAG TPA: hypothetical protein VFB95_08420 [Candidatus Cryosericum sp.]|nr:hypothetical protein [Candidatus Cryosericum sp.]
MIYCKAYQVQQLQTYPGWGGPGVEGLSAEDICYLWEDFVLTRSCLDDERKPLLEVTDAWKEFCTRNLKFAVPDDLKGGDVIDA